MDESKKPRLSQQTMETQATMYCEHCGASIEVDCKFCAECGNKLHEPSANQSQIQPEPPRKHGTISSRTALVVVGMCVVAFFLVVWTFYSSPKGSEFVGKWKNTTGSIVDADVFNAGVKAYDRGDYATALPLFRKLADQGNANAQDYLGFMYYKGQNLKQDYVEAMKYFRKAADQGHFIAQYNLGNMYDKGQNVKQDYVEAMKYFRKAADQGYALAQNNLGVMYYEGQGVTQDYVQAHMWWNLAASQGEKNAREELDRLTERMTADQIAEAQRLARQWNTKRNQ